MEGRQHLLCLDSWCRSPDIPEAHAFGTELMASATVSTTAHTDSIGSPPSAYFTFGPGMCRLEVKDVSFFRTPTLPRLEVARDRF